jgi:hypothetical protein
VRSFLVLFAESWPYAPPAAGACPAGAPDSFKAGFAMFDTCDPCLFSASSPARGVGAMVTGRRPSFKAIQKRLANPRAAVKTSHIFYKTDRKSSVCEMELKLER